MDRNLTASLASIVSRGEPFYVPSRFHQEFERLDLTGETLSTSPCQQTASRLSTRK
jgi:hypothetical protein